MTIYETNQAPTALANVILNLTPEAGIQETNQAPTALLNAILHLPPSAGLQETNQTPTDLINAFLILFPSAGWQETNNTPTAEITTTLYQTVLKLLKMLSDGSITQLDAKTITPLSELINNWFKLEITFRDGTSNTVIKVKIYDEEGNELASAEFTTTELYGLNGSIGLYNNGKVYFDLFETRYR